MQSYEKAKNTCHVRSAIYRPSVGIRYWKNHSIPLDDRIPDNEKLFDDWEEYDPREDDDQTSLWMFND